jgi:hypothetical protein
VKFILRYQYYLVQSLLGHHLYHHVQAAHTTRTHTPNFQLGKPRQKVAIMNSLNLGSAQKDVNYKTRTAVRCYILKEDKICIIHVKKGNYYKLPGGGVEPEDLDDTVSCQREALEETGCEVVVRPELIAQTTEFRGTLQ